MRQLSILLFTCLCMLAGMASRVLALGGDRIGGASAGSERVTARAYISAAPLLPGSTAEVLVEVKVGPGYHIQSAFAKKPWHATRLTAKSGDGITFGTPEFQQDKEIATPPSLGTGTLLVYEGTVYFRVPLTVDPDAAAGSRTLDLSLSVQVCNDKVCYPDTPIVLKVPVTIGQPGDNFSPENVSVFEAAKKQKFLPAPAPETAPVQTTKAATAVSINTGPGRPVELYSNDRQLTLINERSYAPGNGDENSHSFLAILLFALVGGLILNIMPCVLPVIPLKALSFVQQAHGDRRLALFHALAFSAGVVSLFVALAIVLRLFGLFYGQQFQSPAFLITMTLFVVALSLSMLGVWTINPPEAVYEIDVKIAQSGVKTEKQASHPFLSSFGSGVMATLLATPCSAPFLGSVLAWAFVQPPWVTAAMLAVVGVGMSLPYLLLAAFPRLLSRVPRAGRWSELLKQGLGIVMLGVAVYLVTLVPNTQLWPWVLVGAVALSLVCWAWGQIPSPVMERGRVWTIRAAALAIGLLLGLGIYAVAARVVTTRTAVNPSGTAYLPDRADGEWVPFNLALMDEALKQNRPVVVDWTADWCINCRVLEAAVLERDAMKKTFLQTNALLLRADLSEANPPATALNKRLGSEAIPVLAIFKPGKPEAPVVLRDSYSIDRVTSELSQ